MTAADAPVAAASPANTTVHPEFFLTGDTKGLLSPSSDKRLTSGKARPPRKSKHSQVIDDNDGDPEDQELLQKRARIENEIESMKVATMHNMVEDVQVPMGDVTTTCRFLYLSNHLAGQFLSTQSVDNHSDLLKNRMSKVRKELGLGDPKLIIWLMPSRFGSLHWKVFPYYSGSPQDPWRFPAKRTPEVSVEAADETEHQMLLLAKEVILPLAMSTETLIVGQDTCSLTSAFLKVSQAVQNQCRDQCPFRLVIFARAYYYEMRSLERNSIASHFRKRSQAWQERSAEYEKALKKRFGSDSAYWPRTDLEVGRYSLVLFECLKNGELSDEVQVSFQYGFLGALSGVPMISMQTYGTHQLSMLPKIAEHVARGMPLMLLDSRKRSPLPEDDVSIKQAKLVLEETMDKLHEVGVADWYTTSALAFVKGVINKQHAQELAGGARPDAAPAQYIWQAVQARMRQEVQARLKKGGPATEHEDKDCREGELRQAADVLMAYAGGELEWEMEQRHARFRASLEGIEAAGDWKELSRSLEQHWHGLRGCIFHTIKKTLKDFEEQQRGEYFKLCDNGESPNKEWKMGRFFLRVVEPPEEQAGDGEFEEGKAALLELLRGEFDVSERFDRSSLTVQAFNKRSETWLALYDVLRAENVYTSNIYDLRGCREQLQYIARIDYLPPENTLQGLVLLRRAWTLYDVFMKQANFYKMVAKWTFAISLVLGTLLILIVTMMALAADEAPGGRLDVEARRRLDAHQRNLLLVLSLLSAGMTGFTTLIEPSRKWMALRGGALQIKAEIWKFRTRMADYATDARSGAIGLQTAERDCEATFEASLTHVQEKVKQGSGLNRTAFYAVATTAADTLVSFYREQDHQAAAPPPPPPPPVADAPTPPTAVAGEFTAVLPFAAAPLEEEAAAAEAPPRVGLKKLSSASSAAEVLRAASEAGRRVAEVCRRAVGQSAPHMQNSHYVRHGQFDFDQEPLRPGEDDHHSPATPEDFIRWRLVPLRDYYQRKIPVYSRMLHFCQGFILCASVTSAFIAAAFNPKPTAVVASVAGMFTAWMEFNGYDRKLDRCSGVVEALESALVWWQALPEEEKKIIENINHLVVLVEETVQSESAAWFKDASVAAVKSGSGSASKDQNAEDGGDGKAK